MKMSKKLAEDFCDHVCSEDAELYYEAFCQWAAGRCDQVGTFFWSDLAIQVRDCGHKHSAHALYRLASVLASELNREKDFIGRIGRAFTACAERFGVEEEDIVRR
jgi:hypothetical protein